MCRFNCAKAPREKGAPVLQTDTITVFSTTWCGPCRRLKMLMHAEEIPFVAVDIETDPEAVEFVKTVNGGNAVVPVVVMPVVRYWMDCRSELVPPTTAFGAVSCAVTIGTSVPTLIAAALPLLVTIRGLDST